MLANVQQATIPPVIEATVVKGALVHTDEYVVGGFRRSSQHLEGGGCDECSEAAFGRGPAGEVPFAWPAGCGEA
jgi:hypothetical protein